MIDFLNSTLLYYLNKGRTIAWVLFFISIASVTLIVWRFIVLRRSKIDTNEFLGKVRSLLLEENVDGAVKLCESYGGPVAAVFKAGLLRYSQGKSKEDIEKVMENAAVHEVSRLEKALPLPDVPATTSAPG